MLPRLPLVLAGIVSLGIATQPARAQVVRGVALDSVTRDPVSDAMVVLLDSAAEPVTMVRTNARGRFTFKPGGSGYYALDVRSIGFKPHTSQWIALAERDTVEVTVRIVRTAQLLSPVVVSAEREAIGERTYFGMKLKTMSARIITPSEVAAVRGSARDYIEVVQSSMPAGFTVRMLDVRLNQRCIANVRNGKCVTVFVDGVRILNAEQALDVASPERIDHVLVLRAIEAGTLLGGDADAGAVLIFTKGYSGGVLKSP